MTRAQTKAIEAAYRLTLVLARSLRSDYSEDIATGVRRLSRGYSYNVPPARRRLLAKAVSVACFASPVAHVGDLSGIDRDLWAAHVAGGAAQVAGIVTGECLAAFAECREAANDAIRDGIKERCGR